MDEQTGFVLFPVKTHDEGVHADVYLEDVVKRQVQGTRQVQKHPKHFLCVSEFGITSAFLGTCEAHRPPSFFDEIT